MSVWPVASQTRTPLGNGIIVRPAPAAPSRSSSDRPRRRSAPARHPAARSRSTPRRSVRPARPRPSAGAGKAAGGAIVTAAKPGTAAVGAGRSASARSCLRQVKSWLVLTPYRRATPCTVPPGRQRLGDQPALVLVRPAPACLPLEDLDLRHPLAPRTGLTTPR